MKSFPTPTFISSSIRYSKWRYITACNIFSLQGNRRPSRSRRRQCCGHIPPSAENSTGRVLRNAGQACCTFARYMASLLKSVIVRVPGTEWRTTELVLLGKKGQLSLRRFAPQVSNQTVSWRCIIIETFDSPGCRASGILTIR